MDVVRLVPPLDRLQDRLLRQDLWMKRAWTVSVSEYSIIAARVSPLKTVSVRAGICGTV